MSRFSNIVASVLTVLIIAPGIMAQQPERNEVAENRDPRGAFLRSLAMPGWGHFYAGEQNRSRGLAHIGAEAVLIGSFFGLAVRGNRLENDILTLSSLNAGVELNGRNRAFRLAVGDFNSLEEYNDFQLRSRNWDRLFDDIPENRWQWNSTENRLRYRDLRQTRDRVRNQLPAIAGLMVVNRVISAISAYNRARKGLEGSTAHLIILPVSGNVKVDGAVARLQIRF
ncbi:hypothetical protein [Rhodohalobacter mucosus]|uniref:DUF5683 domain-containing protein n=1 Tax=Rhodohalobacter mucosus TaxID=2079485 RepID=A0A316TVS1_9BACT|nr:hypothetical protein [Rhodohalobacter mucosus]PWN07255.1 hypothetical protein DDZ15_05495 [Rhodohalobacter mucosus]